MYAVNISAKFELRSLTRSWDNKGYCKNLGSPWVRPRTIFSQIFNGLLFAWTLWIYLSNLKFVALRVPEIIGGILKNWEVPGYAHAPFSPKFLTAFCSHWRVNIPVKFEVRSFTRSWDNRGYWKNSGRPWIRPRSLFSQIFNGLLLGCTVWIYLPNLGSS